MFKVVDCGISFHPQSMLDGHTLDILIMTRLVISEAFAVSYIHLLDTNNSTDDFNTECIPSLIEEQGTAISSDGTKASTLTYDGVIPKK